MQTIDGWDPEQHGIRFPPLRNYDDAGDRTGQDERDAKDALSGLGFPERISGGSAWTAHTKPGGFAVQLDAALVQTLVRRVDGFLAAHAGRLDLIDAASLPLRDDGAWAALLADVRARLGLADQCAAPEAGSGIVLLRGLPVRKLSRIQSAACFMAIGCHIGTPVSQNAKGHLLGHVKDLNPDLSNPTTRLYTTSQAQRFHTDSCDVVGLLCLHPAAQGGSSAVASSHTVWNQLISRGRADLALSLAQDWVWDRKGETPPGKLPYFLMPIFQVNSSGQVFSLYDRNFFRTIDRFASLGVKPLTQLQKDAMDALEALALENALKMELETGDMQFVNNHSLLHARSGFYDPPDAPEKRHLLRLWLSCGKPSQGGWVLPEKYEERYGVTQADGTRGGIICEGTQLHAPLDP
ncbi:hypothetical protein HK100_009328 [Physocladia obscura]|uniref:TauD/TfdA-like domain-containing protein n=1 Tax=Physocladia obscura TaxID=109957 RepID=A0AAD5X7D9_9FUNG|nr:hypothetical protein HK100_009328 [Physocladia obscura]